jgi:hypothetical protein
MKTSTDFYKKIVLIVCVLIASQAFSQSKNILLIGNSYLLTDYSPTNGQYTRVPYYLQNMITSNGKTDEVFCSSNPGRALDYQLTRAGARGWAGKINTAIPLDAASLNENYRILGNIETALGSVFKDKAGNFVNKWDAVVLQDHSESLLETSPTATDPSAYNQTNIKNYYVSLMDKIIAKSTSVRPKFYLYKTWALLNISGQNRINTKNTITDRLNLLETDLKTNYNPTSTPPANTTTIAVSIVADVVDLYLTNSGNDKIFGIPNDAKHPSLTGSYLIALSLYASIYGEVPEMDSKFLPVEVSLKDAKTIVRLVKQVYTSPTSILLISQNDDYWNITPNPVKENLTVKFEYRNNFDKLFLYNSEGKLVRIIEALATTTINFEDLQKGIYFLRSNTYHKSFKIIKN